MTDWKKLAQEALLADANIDDAEIKVLKKVLYTDGKIDKQEANFLVELRNAYQKKAKGAPLNPKFETFFFKAMQDYVLDNGIISKAETTFLRATIYADGKVEDSEKKFMVKLKKAATKTDKSFDSLYEQVVGN